MEDQRDADQRIRGWETDSESEAAIRDAAAERARFVAHRDGLHVVITRPGA